MRLIDLNIRDLTAALVLCLAAEGRSPRTIEWYQDNLGKFVEYLDHLEMSFSVGDICVDEVRGFIRHQQTEVVRWENRPDIHDTERLSPSTIHGYVRAIKRLWSWLLEEGYVTENPMVRLKLPKVPRKVIDTFTPEQIERMLAVLDRKSRRGLTHYLMILVMLDTGIRLSELVDLDLDNVDLAGFCFKVMGKGNRERMVPFGNQVRRSLVRYLATSRPEPANPDENMLFLTTEGFPMQHRLVQSMVARVGRMAGISGVRCSPHTFRHTFARAYLMRGGDVFSLQAILGHSSLAMVRRYVNLAAAGIARQHRKFSPVDNLGIGSRGRARRRY